MRGKYLGGVAVLLLLYLSTLPLAIATNGTIAYRANTASSCASNALNCPKIREWNSTGSGSFGAELNLSSAGSPVRWAQFKYSPTSQKRLLVTMSDDGNLDAYVCRGSCYSAGNWTVTNNIGDAFGALAHAMRPFDVQFEQATGDAIVVYGVDSANAAQDIGYKVLPANLESFTGITEQYIDNGGVANEYRWIGLDRNDSAVSEQMALVGFDVNNSDVNAWIWNGGAWGNAVEPTAAQTASATGEAVAVKYAGDNSMVMVTAGDGTSGNVVGRKYNNSVWGTANPGDLGTGTADVKWLSLRSDPNTDDFLLAAVSSDSSLSSAYWNGVTWANTVALDAGIDSNAARAVDVVWFPENSRGNLIWDTDTTGTTMSNRTCTPQCTTTTTTISTYAGTGAWVTMYRNPTASEAVDVLGFRLMSTFDIGSFKVNATNLTNYGDTAITADTTVTTFEAYSFDFASTTTGYPNVSYLNSSGGTLTAGTPTTISANVSDTVRLSRIFVSITYPDTSVENISMLNTTFAGNLTNPPNNFSIVFNSTTQTGTYILKLVANDSENLANESISARFTVTAAADTAKPNISYLNSSGGTLNTGTPTTISANVTDNVQLDRVFASITYPAGSIGNITMLNATFKGNLTNPPNNFSIVFNDTTATGTYIVKIVANDTTNNVNESITSRFTVTAAADTVFPNVSYIRPPTGTAFGRRTPVNISANVTDDTQLSQIFASVQFPNGTKFNITMLNTTAAFNTTQQPTNFSVKFNDTSQLGTYTIRVGANDTTNNMNDTVTATFDVTSVVSINVLTSTIDFGALSEGTLSDTTDGTPPPFNLENDGNVPLNITVNASRIFASERTNASGYRFKCRENEGPNCPTGSALSFTDIPLANVTNFNTTFLFDFPYDAANDTRFADILVNVPSDEPGGAKSSIVTFLAAEVT